MAKKKYWAGYCNGFISVTQEKFPDQDFVLAIYLRKKDARLHYQDVRKVEIREIKNSKN